MTVLHLEGLPSIHPSTICIAYIPGCVGYGPCFIKTFWKLNPLSFAHSSSLHGAYTKVPLARLGDQAPQ